METPRFQMCPEDFWCAFCETYVRGTGVTNHCPVCLYSKHVDTHPGDRAARCHGLMKPVGVSVKAGEWKQIHQRCVCGHERANKVQEEDDEDALFALLAS